NFMVKNSVSGHRFRLFSVVRFRSRTPIQDERNHIVLSTDEVYESSSSVVGWVQKWFAERGWDSPRRLQLSELDYFIRLSKLTNTFS
ncbi:hypothetical protein L9F63_001056, partial [Diploptera punctata]